MILSPKDRELLQDYIEVVKEKDRVLWEANMGHTMKPKGSQSNKGCLVYSTLLALFFIWISAYALGIFTLTIVFFSVALSKGGELVGKDYRNKKAQNTQYIITNKGIVFIIWHKGKFHIHNIPHKNIKKIVVRGRNKAKGSIYVIPKEPVSFKTYNYWNDQPSHYITMLNIPYPGEVEAILQKHL